jgi:hypothetical protein
MKNKFGINAKYSPELRLQGTRCQPWVAMMIPMKPFLAVLASESALPVPESVHPGLPASGCSPTQETKTHGVLVVPSKILLGESKSE